MRTGAHGQHGVGLLGMPRFALRPAHPCIANEAPLHSHLCTLTLILPHPCIAIAAPLHRPQCTLALILPHPCIALDAPLHCPRCTLALLSMHPCIALDAPVHCPRGTLALPTRHPCIAHGAPLHRAKCAGASRSCPGQNITLETALARMKRASNQTVPASMRTGGFHPLGESL